MGRKDLGTVLALAMIPAFACQSAFGGLVVHYSFDGNVLDSSGYGNDGTVVGSPVFITGDTGALRFDNPYAGSPATQLVYLPNSPSILGLSSGSFSFAVRFESTDTGQMNGRLFGNVPSSGSGFNFTYNAGATPEAYGGLRGAGESDYTFYGHAFGLADPRAVTTDGQWHWAVLALDRNAKSIDYYVDANLIDHKTYDQLGEISFADLTLGGTSQDLGWSATLTAVDDLRLYDTALTGAEVAALTTAPEPASLGLLGLGAVALLRRRKA